MSQITVEVPDLGGFNDVEVIDVCVRPGDLVAVEQSLLVLESDKATIEVPSTAAGTIAELLVRVGDRVSAGAPIATVLTAEGAEVEGDAATPQPVVEVAPKDAYAADTIDCDVVVLGGGPGGYSAAFRCADLGLRTVIVERYPTLGGVCLNVGCIPSKALLHTAAVIDEARALAAHGIAFGAPQIDLAALRAYKDQVVGKLTGGLAGIARARNVTIVRGVGAFAEPHALDVALTDGDGQDKTGKSLRVVFKQAIVAAGSQSVKLPFIPADPRIVDSTGALALTDLPAKLLVIGGGIIGLEMATVYSTLGAAVDIVEMADGLMQGADRDLVKVWQKTNIDRFNAVMLNTKTVAVDARDDGLWVRFEGQQAPADAQRYDRVLVAVGRTPNGKQIGADRAGLNVDARGFIPVDGQMRTNVPHIFAVGDLVGQPMLAHKAVHQGHVAAEAAAGHKAGFDPLQIPSVAYTDPEVAWAGKTEEQCRAEGLAYEKGVFPWAASGRAIANGRDEGVTKLLFDAQTHRIIGGGIVGTHAGDLIGEICLAIEMGADAVDLGKTIHPHPTLCESIGMAAEVAEGVCTDLPPQKRR